MSLTSLNNSLANARDDKTPQDVFREIDVSATLGINDAIVHVTGFAAAVAVTLPPVGQCAGKSFAIKVLDDASINNVTIQDQDDSRLWADITINAADGDYVLLYCDGATFFVIANKA